jgi:hypothetical protein
MGNVAEKTKLVSDEYISAEGNGVTDAFVEHAMPLTGGLPGRFRPYVGGYWANFMKFCEIFKKTVTNPTKSESVYMTGLQLSAGVKLNRPRD